MKLLALILSICVANPISLFWRALQERFSFTFLINGCYRDFVKSDFLIFNLPSNFEKLDCKKLIIPVLDNILAFKMGKSFTVKQGFSKIFHEADVVESFLSFDG